MNKMNAEVHSHPSKRQKKPPTRLKATSVHFFVSKLMLVVSRPRSACGYGAKAQESRQLISCFGFPLSSMFTIPLKHTEKPRGFHKQVAPNSGLGSEYAAGYIRGYTQETRSTVQSPATTSASEGRSSPVISFIHERLPELSPEVLTDFSMSGTLTETLKSLSLSRGSFDRS